MILLALVYCRNKKLAPRKMKSFLIKSAICFMCLILGLLLIRLIPYAPKRKILQIAWFGVRAIFAFVIYFAMAFALKMDELKVAYDRYLSRFFKKRSTASK